MLFTIDTQTLTLSRMMTQAPASPRPKIRLYVPQPFIVAGQLALSENQSHYLANVMRCQPGTPIAVFNGTDGQWLAEVEAVRKKSVLLQLRAPMQAQQTTPDLWLAFAPIKHHMERMVEKAVELGVSKLIPVVTHYSVVRSVNEEKLMAHAIEAAEQCERHDVPAIAPFKDLPSLLAAWPQERVLLHADESGAGKPIGEVMEQHQGRHYGILIGPEGGFSPEERKMISAHGQSQSFGMGPRILRADTAAIAALACVQSRAGDWHLAPHFEGK